MQVHLSGSAEGLNCILSNWKFTLSGNPKMTKNTEAGTRYEKNRPIEILHLVRCEHEGRRLKDEIIKCESCICNSCY